mmetsp:Transcript_18505/g.38481  ORF Transcript_18505/g.38481 Transcript_18505/m.38481 type:complete len:231 (+) Transcript_18505:299-991(+)
MAEAGKALDRLSPTSCCNSVALSPALCLLLPFQFARWTKMTERTLHSIHATFCRVCVGTWSARAQVVVSRTDCWMHWRSHKWRIQHIRQQQKRSFRCGGWCRQRRCILYCRCLRRCVWDIQTCWKDRWHCWRRWDAQWEALPHPRRFCHGYCKCSKPVLFIRIGELVDGTRWAGLQPPLLIKPIKRNRPPNAGIYEGVPHEDRSGILDLGKAFEAPSIVACWGSLASSAL